MKTDFALKVLTAPLGKTHLFSVGQAGFIIKSASGQLLGIDLYLSDCGERIEGHIGFKRLLPKILATFDLEFDALIATHPHFDHFDPDSIPELMSNHHTKLFASKECRKQTERLQMTDDNITYVAPGDNCKTGNFCIHFVNCDHGKGAPDAVGVIVDVDGKRFYEAGDTCLRLDRIPEYKQFGPIDILTAPINGAYGNMNEKDCASFAAALQPGLVIPCHYGLFASHGGNPGLFYDLIKQTNPQIPISLLSISEKLTF